MVLSKRLKSVYDVEQSSSSLSALPRFNQSPRHGVDANTASKLSAARLNKLTAVLVVALVLLVLHNLRDAFFLTYYFEAGDDDPPRPYIRRVLGRNATVIDLQVRRAWPRRFRGSHTVFKPTIDITWLPNAPSFCVCRFNHACLHKNGTLLVSASLDGHDSLKKKCAHVLPKLNFTTDLDFDLHDPMTHFDLLGHDPARYHIPHFITDALPTLFAASLVTDRFNRSCRRIQADGNETTACFRTVHDERYTAMFVHDRVLSMRLTDWVPEILSMFPGNPLIQSPETLFQKEEQPVRCFASITTYPNSMHRIPSVPDWLGNTTVFSQFSSDERNSAEKDIMQTAPIRHHTTPGNITCRPHIVIVNRDENLSLSRTLSKAQISKFQACLVEDQSPTSSLHLQPNFSHPLFERMDIHKQMSVMRSADIIIGVHGAGMANIVFARSGTPITEIFPFGYYAGPFNGFARVLNMPYTAFTAYPDSVTFEECVRSYEDTPLHEKQEAMVKWNQSVLEWEQNKRFHLIPLDFMPKRSNRSIANFSNCRYFKPAVYRVCPRAERLPVNVEQLCNHARKVVKDVCSHVHPEKKMESMLGTEDGKNGDQKGRKKRASH